MAIKAPAPEPVITVAPDRDFMYDIAQWVQSEQELLVSNDKIRPDKRVKAVVEMEMIRRRLMAALNRASEELYDIRMSVHSKF